ncbi:MAG: hypothetical protein KTR14_03095 [Vampirovibrio sp.]|nr:hypothetical protein [Vampirovibrio sp.]
MTTITGGQGPYSLDTPGAWGGNARHNVGQLLAQPDSRQELSTMSIAVTPESTLANNGKLFDDGFFNVFRYAEDDVAAFDLNDDNILDISELTQVFGGGQEGMVKAHLFDCAVNQDGEFGVSALEHAGYLLTQTRPKQIFANLSLDAVFDAYDSSQFQPDGTITPAERNVMEDIIFDRTGNPLAKMELKSLQGTLNLKSRYEQYQKADGRIIEEIPILNQPIPSGEHFDGMASDEAAAYFEDENVLHFSRDTEKYQDWLYGLGWAAFTNNMGQDIGVKKFLTRNLSRPATDPLGKIARDVFDQIQSVWQVNEDFTASTYDAPEYEAWHAELAGVKSNLKSLALLIDSEDL